MPPKLMAFQYGRFTPDDLEAYAEEFEATNRNVQTALTDLNNAIMLAVQEYKENERILQEIEIDVANRTMLVEALNAEIAELKADIEKRDVNENAAKQMMNEALEQRFEYLQQIGIQEVLIRDLRSDLKRQKDRLDRLYARRARAVVEAPMEEEEEEAQKVRRTETGGDVDEGGQMVVFDPATGAAVTPGQSDGKFIVTTSRGSGKAGMRPKGESVSPRILLRRMRDTYREVTGKSHPPSYFEPGTPGYIPFYFKDGACIVPGGWDERQMIQASKNGKAYYGMNPSLVTGPPLSSAIVDAVDEERRRGNKALTGIIDNGERLKQFMKNFVPFSAKDARSVHLEDEDEGMSYF